MVTTFNTDGRILWNNRTYWKISNYETKLTYFTGKILWFSAFMRPNPNLTGTDNGGINYKQYQ